MEAAADERMMHDPRLGGVYTKDGQLDLELTAIEQVVTITRQRIAELVLMPAFVRAAGAEAIADDLRDHMRKWARWQHERVQCETDEMRGAVEVAGMVTARKIPDRRVVEIKYQVDEDLLRAGGMMVFDAALRDVAKQFNKWIAEARWERPPNAAWQDPESATQ